MEESPPPAPVERSAPTAEVEDVPAFLRVPRPEPVEPPAEPAKPAVQVVAEPPAEPAKPPVEVVAEPPAPKQTIAKAANIRKRLPAALSTVGQTETAGSSYKTFKESREELIQRLVDPILTLEEVARVLNVCPTTVRRYTNRGAIAHHRTAGNQRRFRLSDVLAFMERQSRFVQE
jgi:excisionase family DNA binding protein